MRCSIRLLVLPLVLQVAACAMNPPQLGGKFGDVSITQASTDKTFAGEDVRWGGIVTGTRWNDSGNCLEIAWSPLDRFSLQPVYASTTRDTANHPYDNNPRPINTAYRTSEGQIVATPRFLACSENMNMDSRTYFVAALVTVAGTVDTPKIFQVAYADCFREL